MVALEFTRTFQETLLNVRILVQKQQGLLKEPNKKKRNQSNNAKGFRFRVLSY
jgi:hypothetical protein